MSVTASSIHLLKRIIELDNPQVFKWSEVFFNIQKIVNSENILKVNLVKTTKNKLFFYVVSVEDLKLYIENPFMPNLSMSVNDYSCEKDISCLIIPTGVGASFGGYAGDANPIAKLFSYSNKYLLTHPNVVNGAVLSDIPANAMYLEGFFLDQFLLGKINLTPKNNNSIGVIFDKGINDERLNYEVNVLNALKAFYGCNIKYWTVTEKPLNITPEINQFGFSSGNIENIDSLIDAAMRLKSHGVTAITICAAIPDDDLNIGYKYGIGIDPISGIESIISHIVSAVTGLVSAHAPVLLSKEKINFKDISPVSASEYIAQTFLPSVISGLRFAPSVEKASINNSSKMFFNVKEIFVPYNAFGSAGTLFSNEVMQNVTLIKENRTSLQVSPSDLNMNFKVVDSYNEIFNEEQAYKAGIDMKILKRPIERIPQLPN